MDRAPPPPLQTPSSTSFTAAAASPSSCLGLPSGSILSQSQRRSSLHPPLPPNNRLSSFAGSGPSSSSFRQQFPSPAVGRGWVRRRARSGHALDDLYEELCSIRRTSVEYLAHLDALAAANRTLAARTSSSHTRMQTRDQQLPHHQARPSSSMMTFSGGHRPPQPLGTFSRHNTPSTSRCHHRARPSQGTASLLPALPRGTFSRRSTPSTSRFQQQARLPSQTTASLLPRRGSSSWQQARQPSWLSTSGLSDLSGGSGSVRARWLSRPQHEWPSSSSWSGRLDLMPNSRNISPEYSSSFPQLQQACPSSSTTRLPYLPGASFSSGYNNAPSSSQQQQQQHQHARPSSSSSSLTPNLTNGPVFGNAPSLSPQVHHASGGSSSTMASGLPPLPPESFVVSAFAQPPSREARNSAGSETFSAGSPSWSAGPPPSSSNDITSAGTGFVQPASSSGQYELPPLPPSLPQMTLLPPVKQEPVMDSSSVRLEPEELIDIDEDTTDDLDTLLASLESCPDLMASLDSSPDLEGVPLLHSSSSGNNEFFSNEPK